MTTSKRKVKKGRKIKRHPDELMLLSRDIIFLVLKICMIVMFLAVIFASVLGIFRISNMEMAPSYREGDLVIYNRLDKEYEWWDCIILKYKGKKQICRVVAGAGDRVEVTEEGIIVNGYPQQEKFIYGKTEAYAGTIEYPVVLEENEVFVLADAREDTTDSRVYGAVDVGETYGKVIMVIRNRGF